jgi:Ca2+-transporting ATPase
MLVFMYIGEDMFFKPSFNLITTPIRNPQTALAGDPLVLDTIQFYIFVLMNLFNQFNCRMVEDGRFNIFSGIFKNFFYILVVGFEFFLTWAMVDIGSTTIGSSLIGTATLAPMEHLCCWLVGASVLIWGAILKKIPAHHFDWLTSHIHLEEDR